MNRLITEQFNASKTIDYIFKNYNLEYNPIIDSFMKINNTINYINNNILIYNQKINEIYNIYNIINIQNNLFNLTEFSEINNNYTIIYIQNILNEIKYITNGIIKQINPQKVFVTDALYMNYIKKRKLTNENKLTCNNFEETYEYFNEISQKTIEIINEELNKLKNKFKNEFTIELTNELINKSE